MCRLSCMKNIRLEDSWKQIYNLFKILLKCRNPSKCVATIWLKTSLYCRRSMNLIDGLPGGEVASWLSHSAPSQCWKRGCPSACSPGPLRYWLSHSSDPARLTTATNWKSSASAGPFRDTTATSAKSCSRLIYFWLSSSTRWPRERPQHGLNVKVLLGGMWWCIFSFLSPFTA